MEQIKTLLNQTDHWIRFELGINALKGEAYFTEILQRAMKLCHALFREEGEEQRLRTPLRVATPS